MIGTCEPGTSDSEHVTFYGLSANYEETLFSSLCGNPLYRLWKPGKDNQNVGNSGTELSCGVVKMMGPDGPSSPLPEFHNIGQS